MGINKDTLNFIIEKKATFTFEKSWKLLHKTIYTCDGALEFFSPKKYKTFQLDCVFVNDKTDTISANICPNKCILYTYFALLCCVRLFLPPWSAHCSQQNIHLCIWTHNFSSSSFSPRENCLGNTLYLNGINECNDTHQFHIHFKR